MIWVVLLAGAAALFALLWGLQRRSLQQAARSLREIGNGEAGRRLRLETPGKTMEELVWEVNRMLDEKQQAQIAYRRSEKERRDEIANISHDLRTPLTSILGYLQLAQTEDCTEEERKEYLRIAENRAHSLQTLLLHGVLIGVGQKDIHCFFIEDLCAVHALDHLAGSLAGAEAGNAELAALLQVSLVDGGLKGGGICFNGQCDLALVQFFTGFYTHFDFSSVQH